jgi:hypothetical protein
MGKIIQYINVNYDILLPVKENETLGILSKIIF